MPATILVGAQWGDEGKGRVADWLAADSDVVARFGGGDNAGHTVYTGSTVYKLHLVPSGILHSRVTCVLGGGMVINPVNLLREMDDLRALGVEITPERFMISTRAHIISPAHIALDKASEKARGADKIGTTLRGIGPAYMDKTGRSGLRMGQMIDVEAFAEALYAQIKAANASLARDGCETIDPQASAEAYVDAAARLRPYLTDTTRYLNARLRDGARVLCEGAQGTMLDIDHGTYPYVTSSNASIGGACTGLGIPPRAVHGVLGVAKAYTTRVGEGPLPTELTGEMGERLRESGQEYGASTGRPRRCGWYDAVAVRYAVRVNGIDALALTKLDVLDGLERVDICTGYAVGDRTLTEFPADLNTVGPCTPIYESWPGWSSPTKGVTRFEQLPTEARRYIARLEEVSGVPMAVVSTGSDRGETIIREDTLAGRWFPQGSVRLA